MIKVEVKYFDMEMPRLRMDPRGDWVDVRASGVEVNGIAAAWRPGFGLAGDEDAVWYRAGDTVLVRLGFAMKFPKAYEAHVLPRSSLFKKTGLMLVNGMGLIDHTYCGDGDEWLFPCYAMRDGKLVRHSRIGQFRLLPRMMPVAFHEVAHLGNVDRGGYGSTDARPGLQMAEELDNAEGR